MSRPANPRAVAVNKALTKAGFDDVDNITVKERDGYVEIRGDSQKAYAAAITNSTMFLNVIRFAEPKATGVYGKAVIARDASSIKGKNKVRRNGFIAHIPA